MAEGGKEFTADGEISLKLLIPNYFVGALIGKAGATISQVQADTATRIRVSQNGVYFPGTHERAVLVVGTPGAVTNAVNSIAERITAMPLKDIPAQHHGLHELRLNQTLVLIPPSGAGVIIGKGGESIKALQTESGARLGLSAKDDFPGTLGERILTLSGSSAQVTAAAAAVVKKLASDSTFLAYQNTSLQYDQLATPPLQHARVPASHYAAKFKPVHITISIPVPDTLIGGLIGKAGKNIFDMQLKSDATITVSDKTELVPGTTNRTVYITGEPHCAQIAHNLVQQKLAQIQAQVGKQ